MKITSLTMIALLTLRISAFADYVIQEKMEHNETPAQDITIKLKEGKARCDLGTTMSSIVSGNDIVMLMHSQKIAMKMPFSPGPAQTAAATSPRPTLQSTGRKEKISGYDTEEYVHENPQFKATMHLWIAKDFPEKAEIMKMLTGLQTATMRDLAQSMGSVSPEDYPGLPIRTEIESNLMGKPSKTIVTITSIKKEAVDDSAFAIPSDYHSAGR